AESRFDRGGGEGRDGDDHAFARDLRERASGPERRRLARERAARHAGARAREGRHSRWRSPGRARRGGARARARQGGGRDRLRARLRVNLQSVGGGILSRLLTLALAAAITMSAAAHAEEG